MKVSDYARLGTERPNRSSKGLDRLTLNEQLDAFGRADRDAVNAVARVKPQMAQAVKRMSEALARGGRLFLAGAGTSGRLCVLEAAECPPTFNTRPSDIVALMAGGRSSVFRSREGAEDDGADARRRVTRLIRRGDVLIAVAASGVTAFALEAQRTARRLGATTILVTCNPPTQRVDADVVIAPVTGPEILTGSTRLKAGTATKLVLNTLTTLTMARLGKVYDHWMVDLVPRSAKLRARALRLVATLGRVSPARATSLLTSARGQAKLAIVMARRNVSPAQAQLLLKNAAGRLRDVIG